MTTTDSPKAIAARLNGSKSRGPVTEEGKKRSSQNALKHGLTAANHLSLPDDDENACQQFYERMLKALNPQGDLQQYFAQRAIDCMWRLRRILALEANLLHPETQPHYTKRTCYNFSHNDWTLAHLHICRYEATLERALKNALAELRKLQNEPNSEPLPRLDSSCETREEQRLVHRSLGVVGKEIREPSQQHDDKEIQNKPKSTQSTRSASSLNHKEPESQNKPNLTHTRP